ncbi:hypothetical protein K458DRAFT_491691 [Lentithecium fluviatile CBS 122367]|uniref:Zn(2)-C6 fungal-type domain-containing protein n=1 Tax=Lentithecium fluviatile CBS 122367 TaxID=1168545 RepID=A0A6G1IHC0_9PLEO|nr:hypothetical protein K458DRAFT_491691 [Lentithecium fluviatile CBS 122367]
MGYFGRPSSACALCRSRRIKCDLSRPSCGQCERVSRVCSGYRSRTDLVFRDQTNDVVSKAQRANRPSRQVAAGIISKRSPAQVHYEHEKTQSDISKSFDAADPVSMSLPLSLEHQAFCFFYSNYISRPSKKAVTVYESVPALYLASPNDSALLYVITALGLAGLSHHTETYGMETAAEVWYNKALHEVHRNLRDLALAKEDLTLLVVLLLGLYETNTCRTPRSMKSWLRHTRGATVLLELRGETQLDTEFGRTLFAHSRAQIIAGCIQTRTPLPEIVIHLSQKCRDSNTNPLEDIVPLSFHFCYLRSKFPFIPVNDQSEPRTRAIIAQYSAVSHQMRDWHCSLPSGFAPAKIFSVKSSSSVLSEYYHVYDDAWTAGAVNNSSASYILVNEALIVQLSFLRDHYAHDPTEFVQLNDKISKARDIIIYQIEAVCASVPDLLQSNMAVAGVGLLWALYVSAQISPRTASVQDTTRRWITGRLEKIGAELGVCQATTLAGLLREEVEVTQLLDDGVLEVENIDG